MVFIPVTPLTRDELARTPLGIEREFAIVLVASVAFRPWERTSKSPTSGGSRPSHQGHLSHC
jgi:hypothetical protein